MIELASALTLPIAKLLLKSWLGESVAVDIGDSLLKLGFKRFGDWAKARDTEHQANRIAGAVVNDLEAFFSAERVDELELFPAAVELGETIQTHITAALLINQKLNAKAIGRALLGARPIDRIYRSDDPGRGLYVRLIEALAPRLRKIAIAMRDYELERDAAFLQGLAGIADNSEEILANLEIVRRQTARTETMVEDLATREDRKRVEYEASYRKAVLSALDYVEILGLDIDRARREVSLSIAYLSLTTKLGDLGRLEYETLLRLLPICGNRLIILGAAGSGKSTLLRWTAVEAAAAKENSDEFAATIVRAVDFIDPRCYRSQVASKTIFDRFHSDDCTYELNRELHAHFLLGQSTVEQHDLVWRFLSAVDKRWRRCIPFLIRLRNVNDRLPRPDDFPSHLSTIMGNPPENWVRDLLQKGDALLLFDGIDEVPEGAARDAALTSIEQYVRQYEHCPVIVTS